MDTDDLDRWLDADDDEPAGQPRWPSTTVVGDSSRSRPRWLWVALTGVGLWLAVIAVAVLGDESDVEGDPVTAMDDDLLAQGVAGASSGPDIAAVPPPDEGSTPDRVGGVDGSGGADGSGGGHLDPDVRGLLHGAAVTALRRTLTTSADGRDSYLEHATPVAVHHLGDAAVVTIDATWLEGGGGVLDQVRQGRWSLPVALDGTVLGPAWPVPTGPDPLEETADPPVGTVALAEIRLAMESAGWTDVEVAAGEDHPFLPDVMIALVGGRAPDGSPRAGDIVWLHRTDDGLRLLGADTATAQDSRPPDDQSADGAPAAGESATAEPADGEPADGDPAAESAAGESAAGEPADGDPAAEPAAGEPAAEPTATVPAAGDPATGDPAASGADLAPGASEARGEGS